MSAKTEHRVLVGVDGSDGAERALSLLGALPRRAGDEVVVASRPAHVLAARPGGEDAPSMASADALERSQAIVDLAVAHLRAAGVSARGVACEGENDVDALVRTAEREHASLVVVGSRGRGRWASVLLGSTARSLAILSPVPVLVVREPRAPVVTLAATDGSPAARAALAAYAALPRVDGARVELLHVVEPHAWEPADATWATIADRSRIERDEDEAAGAALDAQRRLLPRGVDVAVRIERGHVAETVLARAGTIGADLIVLGTRGLAGPRALLFGSTAERVITDSRTNVLVAPAPPVPARS